MDGLSLRELVPILQGELVAGQGQGGTVRRVTTHSERIPPESAFFALRGARGDGHDFVEAALRNGARAAVVAHGRAPTSIPTDAAVVEVEDPLRSLQLLAAWWRSRIAARVVAVAGSIGKTVTKDCLVRALQPLPRVYGTPGSYNSQLGIPLAILECPIDAEVAVIEVAVSDPGEMSRIAPMLRPHDVIVTNVGTRWRHRFATRVDQIEELLELAREIPAGGWLLLGEDDPDLLGAAKGIAGAVHVAGKGGRLPAFTRAPDDPHRTVLQVAFPDGASATIGVRTVSPELLGDVEAAICAASLLGVDGASLAARLEDYAPTATRREIWRSPSGVTLVRDAATPDPMTVVSAMRAARGLARKGGRTVVVLDPPTGGWDDDAASAVGAALAAEGADEVLGVGAAGDVAPALAARIAVRSFGTVDELRQHLVSGLEFGDVCLVQAPVERGIGALSSALVEAMAPTRLYLDISAMEENVATFKRLVGPDCRLMAMVKALAYGTDALALSLSLHSSGVDMLGVAGADEGIDLRRAGVDLPIVVMLAGDDEMDKMVRYGLTPVLYSERMVAAAVEHAARSPETFGVHLEVDTGMHRAGLDWDAGHGGERSAGASLRRLRLHPNILVEGLMTHLACADDPSKDDVTARQLARFEAVVDGAHELGLRPLLHAAATAGAIRFPRARYDLVRIGLGLFGFQPSGATASELPLTPAVSLVSRIVHVTDVPQGESVGYGATWAAPAGGARVGLVPAGYFDCVPRACSNNGYVVVAGTRCPIVGVVSMDSLAVDLSACPGAVVGSDVLVFGRLSGAEVPIEDLAGAVGTIPYEVMARVGPRVQRVLTRH